MQVNDFQGKAHNFELSEVSGYRELKDFAFYGTLERCTEFEGKHCTAYFDSSLDCFHDGVIVFFNSIDKSPVVFVPQCPFEDNYSNEDTYTQLKAHFNS